MANYANQHRIYTTQFETIEHTATMKGQFLKPMVWEKLDNINTDLTGNELKLWLYIMKWYGQGYYDFSPVNLEIALGISKNTILSAKEELIKKGYIVSKTKTTFDFIPYPEGVELRALKKREDAREKIDARNTKKKQDE